MRKAKIVFAVIGVCGILVSLLIIVAIFSPADNWISEKNSTYAVVTNIKENFSASAKYNGQETIYDVDAEYIVDNVVYPAKFQTQIYYDINDKKSLYYNQKKHSEYVWGSSAFFHTTVSRIVTFFIVFIISCLFLFLSLKLRVGLL